MNQRKFQVGPGAASLLLIAVILSMCVLGTLSLRLAQSDLAMSERGSTIAVSTAELFNQAEASFARLDAAVSAEDWSEDKLPEEMLLDGDTVRWTEHGEDGRILRCAVRILPEGKPRCIWTEHSLSVEYEETGDF